MPLIPTLLAALACCAAPPDPAVSVRIVTPAAPGDADALTACIRAAAGQETKP